MFHNHLCLIGVTDEIYKNEIFNQDSNSVTHKTRMNSLFLLALVSSVCLQLVNSHGHGGGGKLYLNW